MGTRLGRPRSLVYFAVAHDRNFRFSDMVEPDTARPDPSQIDVVHATGIQRHVLLLSCGLGSVLVNQQYFVHRATVDDQ